MDLEHSEWQTANRMNSVLLGLYVHTHLHICPTTGYQWPTASGRSPQNMHVIVCTHNSYVGHNMAERACTSGQLHDSPERPVNRPIETLYCFWSNYRRKVRKVRKKKHTVPITYQSEGCFKCPELICFELNCHFSVVVSLVWPKSKR